jgi:simple sugar transport system substrate-binding protein
MKRREFLATSAGTALAIGFGAPALAESHGPLKAGYIYVGPVGDLGWSYQHDVGRLEAVAATGAETVYVESVPEGPDAERVLTQMALDGAKIIFTTSFGYMDATMNVAAKFPDVKFEHATGYKRADNVATYNARFYEGRAVIGHIAGKMTKTNTIGYIGSFPIPEVIMGINSAYLHAKKANPEVQFKVIWAFTWFDPAKEGDAAKALIEQGCDVIMQHTDSTAPVTIAEEKGIYCFGQASDMAKFAPNALLTSIVDNWGPYYTKRLKAVMDGTWASTDTWDGIGEGGVVIAPLNEKVPADVKAEVEALMASIADKSYHPFTGPLNWQDGTEMLAAGAVIDDGTLAGMMKYVEGIEGEIPS